MASLYYNQKHLELFGFCPKEDGTSDAIVYVKRYTVLHIIVLHSFVGSVVYPFRHPDEPDVFLSALTPIIAYILVPTSYLTFFLEGKRSVRTFSNVRKLVDERK